jgi:hypothetical protein
MNHARTAGLATSLIGALWAAHKAQCEPCGGVPKLWGYSFDKLGIAFYSLMLMINWLNAIDLNLPLRAAAYIHGFLVVHMLITNQFCLACSLSAVGAVLAASQY